MLNHAWDVISGLVDSGRIYSCVVCTGADYVGWLSAICSYFSTC